jgi:diaminohydroxyphosphoribosylaminopyrimidine deaminase/5-amino-6-(5-phosphoribosylamino)uracil reductase
VTLEPCFHVGRTAPCAELVVRAGLRRVMVGHIDPHRLVAGRGVRCLRRKGTQVRVGVLEAECREQHRGFLSVCERGRPFVVLKLASSMDGRVATASGESRWISGPEARAAVHRLRGWVDAGGVGSGTALTDDPELTARRAGRLVHAPIRVLVDSALRVPPDAKLHQGEAGQSWVLCAPRAPASRRRGLAASGARLLDVPARGGHLDLRRALRRLAREGLTEVLVEGGGKLAGALLRAGLVDEVHWFVSPRLLGGDARPAIGDLGLRKLAHAPELTEARVRRVGRDVEWVGRLGSGRRTQR